MLNILKKIIGAKNEREINRISSVVEKINALEPSITSLTDADLRAKTDEFRSRIADGETLDDLLPEAFAVCREASKRVLKMRHFDVQLLGGVVLHEGRIAEMKTGEGKTLVATLPVYLNALDGKGVHVVTVNDYLARRDAQWMSPLYQFLGLSVGVIVHGLTDEQRQVSYNADITYGTNNEFGLDYLRDNMKYDSAQFAQRELNYAIVDEVDRVVEDRHEMLADPYEIAEAEEEGIVIHNHSAPKRILSANGRVSGLETLDVARALDERGRFYPQLLPATEKVWECDSFIISIGQTGELEWVQPGDGLEVTPHGTLKVDPQTLATTAEGVYAGGDIAFGPRLIINAVADGQRAARSIHSYLQHLNPRVIRKGFFTPVPKRKYANTGPMRDFLRWQRQQPPALTVVRRIGVSRVEIGYDESTARQQGGRCLICTLNPIFDGDLCILCNGCVDVCPMDCLKLVPVPSLLGDERVAAVIKAYTSAWEESSAMLLDPARCIRCGLCAARCPTEAVKMEEIRFTEEVLFDPVD